MLLKYNTSMETILGRWPGGENSTPLRYEKANYKLNRDFQLRFMKIMVKWRRVEPDIEEIYTLMEGKCYKVTFNQTLKGSKLFWQKKDYKNFV